MKLILLFIIALNVSLTGFSQITKNNWLVGGSGIYSANANNLAGVTTKQNVLELFPAIGYFFVDKFCIGIKTDFSFRATRYGINGGSGAPVKYKYFAGGPFLRYYFLGQENRVNLFAEGNYAYGIGVGKADNTKTINKFYRYSFLVGPVVYFNNCVGLEFTVGYYGVREIAVASSDRTIQVGLGLQIHLERDK